MTSFISKILNFNKQRNWDKMTPEQYAVSVSIEAAELLELYQWGRMPSSREALKHEIADVLWYLVCLCKVENIDIAEAVESKLKHNEEKYPLEMFKNGKNSSEYLKRKAMYRNG